MDKFWLVDYIKNGYGLLCVVYFQEYISEGDIFFFMFFICNGFEQYIDYILGGWGGCLEYKNGNYM